MFLLKIFPQKMMCCIVLHCMCLFIVNVYFSLFEMMANIKPTTAYLSYFSLVFLNDITIFIKYTSWFNYVNVNLNIMFIMKNNSLPYGTAKMIFAILIYQ